MPSCLAEVMKAQDLRLLHACLATARARLVRYHQAPPYSDPEVTQILDLVRQAEGIAQTEMNKANIIPARSIQELRDEMIPDNELPVF